ncbi:hypothetical protein BDZ89DRAFT_1110660 [Hymenopellis radicata]|nr:hypothetical protein BDZ89DRAFT_1110660 [Hymenopellis radicata]
MAAVVNGFMNAVNGAKSYIPGARTKIHPRQFTKIKATICLAWIRHGGFIVVIAKDGEIHEGGEYECGAPSLDAKERRRALPVPTRLKDEDHESSCTKHVLRKRPPRTDGFTLQLRGSAQRNMVLLLKSGGLDVGQSLSYGGGRDVSKDVHDMMNDGVTALSEFRRGHQSKDERNPLRKGRGQVVGMAAIQELRDSAQDRARSRAKEVVSIQSKLSGDVLGEEEREAGIVDTGWFGVKSRLGENSRRDGFRKGRHTKVWERKPNRHGQPKTWVEG